jgi:DNA mismatch repair ATPase MutS
MSAPSPAQLMQAIQEEFEKLVAAKNYWGKNELLFVIDEILKGTNTRERLAASNAILSYMVQKQGFLLIATHDLELVYALKNRYDTYYFDSQVHEKDIVFPYKIRRGIVGKTNAIDLMELLDFPEEITDQARREVGKR